MADHRVILYLLETSNGGPLQFWTLDRPDLVRIGRAIDNDVIVLHPRVSRAHAWIRKEEDHWRLGSISLQGVFLGDRQYHDLILEPGLVFRLGASGPFFRFGSHKQDFLSSASTENVDLTRQVRLSLDHDRLTQDVRAITDSPYFRHLREAAARLRNR